MVCNTDCISQTRARGSVKRRPPSRAHRKSAIGNQDPSETPASTTNPDSDTTTNTVTAKSESNPQTTTVIAQSVTTTTTTIAAATPANSEPQHISAPSEKGTHAAVIDKVDSPLVNAADSAMVGNKNPVTSKSNLNIGAMGESKKDAVKDDVSSVVTKSNSALHQSKQEPVTNTSKASSSLFGGSDSEDEDLFGQKPKSQPVKTSELPISNNVTKQTEKAAKPVSLFGDDDDDDDGECNKLCGCYCL